MSGIPITGKARGSAGAAFEIAKRRGALRLDFLRDYLIELYRVAGEVGIDADVLVAQADLETGAFTSFYYVHDGNVAGFGAFDDGSNLGLQYGAQKAARGHVAHMAAYVGLTDIPQAYIAADPRWDAVKSAGYVGTVTTTADLGNGRWATDPEYPSKLLSRYRAYWGEPVTSQTEGTDMGMKAYRFPGLANPVYLPDWITVTIAPVDHPNVTGRQKSSRQTRTTWHDTGNPNTNAAGEFAWLRGGRNGGEAGGYNGIFDDRNIFITGWFDEVTWHAGTPDGNATSYGFEQAWGAGVDFQKSLEVGAALHGGVIAAKGWSVDQSLVQHNFWYGKDCPGQIRHRGLWPQVVQMVREATARARAAATGAGGVFKTGDTITVTRYHHLNASPDGPETLYLPPGSVGTIIATDGPKFDKYGTPWWNTQWTAEYGGGGTGYLPENALAKRVVTDPKPTSKAFTLRFRLPLRSAAGFNGTILTELAEGTNGTILAGPTSADGIDWYRVQTSAGVGFVPASIIRTLEISETEAA